MLSCSPNSRCYDFIVKRRGKFITFEGLDGCGKSTQLNRLADVLRAEGIQLILTREPGGTPIGEQIRAVLLDSRTHGLAPLAELALMFASRAQQLDEVIKPALAEGKWVLCDRFTDSSEAYQGGGRQLGSEPVLTLHRVLCGDLQPDLTILMDSDVAASVARARRRNKNAVDAAQADENRFEKETAPSSLASTISISTSPNVSRSVLSWSTRASPPTQPIRRSLKPFAADCWKWR